MGLFDVFKKKGAAPAPARPGVVFVNPGSKVYHCEGGGCGGISVDAAKMPESKAVASGLSRCRRCDWYEFDREAGNGKK